MTQLQQQIEHIKRLIPIYRDQEKHELADRFEDDLERLQDELNNRETRTNINSERDCQTIEVHTSNSS